MPSTPASTTRAQWLALTAALLGWMFDGFEMGVFSLVGRAAVKDLLSTSDERVVGLWFGVVTAGFLVGAATGGVLFGWLGDRIGRVRAMTASVLTYALFTGLCGFVNEAWQIGVLRFVAALGMGGEWSLGVALVMEVWPNRSRAFMAGLIGAAANVGYVLVGVVGLVLVNLLSHAEQRILNIGLSPESAATLVANKGWRLVMICGAAPALLTFLLRLFVPESEKWRREQAHGHTSHWATRDLLAVIIGALGPGLMITVWALRQERGWPSATLAVTATLVGLLVVTAGYTYPVIRYLQRHAASSHDRSWAPTIARMLLAACLSGVPLLATWGSTQLAPTWADQLSEKHNAADPEQPITSAKEYALIWISLGAVFGTLLAALLGDWLGRRAAYCLLCLVSIASILLFYQPWTTRVEFGAEFLLRAFIIGACTASFYGWLPLYLPELFHTRVRATGQGFGFNFGRILAAVGTLQLGNLMGLFKDGIQLGGLELTGGYPAACSVMSLIYVVGLVLIWFAPETKGRPLPE